MYICKKILRKKCNLFFKKGSFCWDKLQIPTGDFKEKDVARPYRIATQLKHNGGLYSFPHIIHK